MTERSFSDEIENWLTTKQPKTLGNLAKAFGKNSFATIFILCMALPATPVPTGGLTHVLEVIVALVALQTIIGLKSLWFPEWLAKRALPESIVKKALPKFVYYLRRLEKYSRVRGTKLLNNSLTVRFAGLAVLVFAAGAFFAIPFSNLDTVVSIGAVVLSLGLVLNDIVYFIAGLIIGTIGIIIEITIGKLVAAAMQRLWANVGIEARIAAVSIIVLLIAVVVYRHIRNK